MHTERRSPCVLKWRITCRRPVIVDVILLKGIMAKPSFRFSIRTLLLLLTLSCVVIELILVPVTVRVPISGSLIMNSVHYSEGLCINVYDGEDLVAGNTLIVSRKMDVQSIPVTPDEIEKILKGEMMLPTPEDNSYLEIRVNLIQKLRLRNATDIRVGGLPPPNSE